MSETTTGSPDKQKSIKDQRRVKVDWIYLYFVLAAFDILAICASLYSSHRNLERHSKILQSTDTRIELLNTLAELDSRVRDVNAPGNDVFDTQDVALERQRADLAWVAYEQTFQKLRQQSTPLKGNDLGNLDTVHSSMESMRAVAVQIFDCFEAK